MVYLVIGNISWTVLLVPFLIVLLTMFALGLGFVLAILNAKLRDVNYIVTVLLNLAFYSAPIIYPLDKVPAGIKPILLLNPLGSLIEAWRSLFIDGDLPGLDLDRVARRHGAARAVERPGLADLVLAQVAGLEEHGTQPEDEVPDVADDEVQGVDRAVVLPLRPPIPCVVVPLPPYPFSRVLMCVLEKEEREREREREN